MDTLDLLWELENYNLKLQEYKEKIKELEKSKSIEKEKMEFENIKIDYENKKSSLNSKERETRKFEGQLKNKEFLHKENKDLLYQGNISDIKQLEQLTEENNVLEEEIDDLESKILNNLEEIDFIKNYLENTNIQIKDKSNYIDKEIKKNKLKREKFQEELEEIKETINKLTINIEKNTLNLYKKIKRGKLNAIALAKDNICTGCNMKIPSHQVQILREDEKIVLCQSCGRILYYKPSKAEIS